MEKIDLDSGKKKHKIKTKVIACKTIRQKNGVALSSRNLLLNSEDQIIASKIYMILRRSKVNLIRSKNLLNSIKNKILKFGIKKIDYLKVLDINKIIKPYKKKSNKKIFIAYYINSVRLIDNI